VEGSASNFPGIGSESHDIIFSNYVIHWIPDRGSYRGILVMSDYLVLISVKREFRKLLFVIRELKILIEQ